MHAALREALGARLGRRALFDEPLARWTSLRVGGPASVLARIDTLDELRAVRALARDHDAPLLVLGAGFNTLVLDGGFPGVVLRLQGLREVCAAGGRVRAGAGATHSAITRAAAEAGLSGLEFGAGIPGTLGGWVAMNAGTRERELADALRSVTWVSEDGEVVRRDREQVRFEYRRAHLPAGAVIAGAELAVQPDDPERIRRRMHEQLEMRRATQPIDRPSCGSVFKNPPGDHAGRLIEAAGLKGERAGGAAISEQHANFIVTRAGARASDVMELIERARVRVRDHAGIDLETEVRIVGEPG